MSTSQNLKVVAMKTEKTWPHLATQKQRSTWNDISFDPSCMPNLGPGLLGSRCSGEPGGRATMSSADPGNRAMTLLSQDGLKRPWHRP